MRADTRDELDERLTHKPYTASDRVAEELAQTKTKRQPKAKAAKTEPKRHTYRIRVTVTTPHADVNAIREQIESELLCADFKTAKVTRIREVVS